MLAMFTISARYTNYYPPPLSGTMWEAGCEFLDQAKYILSMCGTSNPHFQTT